MVSSFDVRVMSAIDLARALDWAAAEGWNPGLDDAHAFQIADPQGFLVGRLDGEPVSCVSVVRYGADFGFLGFYIAQPRARGRGYGLRVWNAGLAHLRGRMVGLDGVPAQQDNYRKSGFRLAWRNIRYQGPAAARGMPPPGIALEDAKALPFDTLAAYDRRFFPAPRDGFLANWIGAPGHVALAAIRDGALAGLGVIRPCRTGFKIGPLYAADAAIAAALIGGLCERAGPGVVALDVPESNARAVHLAESLGMVPAFETARMYTGAAPTIDAPGLFGVTTFELG
jgi:ribosomal protein S18 acetylase RimI-like enzyme/RimJ/RimL family protein N-acetyltransferase